MDPFLAAFLFWVSGALITLVIVYRLIRDDYKSGRGIKYNDIGLSLVLLVLSWIAVFVYLHSELDGKYLIKPKRKE